MLVDGTFWRNDELARLGISTRSARDMGHLPLSGPTGRSRRSLDEIVGTLSERYEGADLRDDVLGLVNGLTQKGLVVDAAA